MYHLFGIVPVKAESCVFLPIQIDAHVVLSVENTTLQLVLLAIFIYTLSGN